MCVFYQDICFWQNGLHVANVTEFIAAGSGASQERFVNLLFSSLYCHLKVSFKAVFNVHFANLVSKEYFSIQRLIIFLLYE